MLQDKASFGIAATIGVPKISITSPGVRKDESRNSTAYAAVALPALATTKPIMRIMDRLASGNAGITGGTAMATLAILF